MLFPVTPECALCAPLALLPLLTSVVFNTGSFKGGNCELSYLLICSSLCLCKSCLLGVSYSLSTILYTMYWEHQNKIKHKRANFRIPRALYFVKVWGHNK